MKGSGSANATLSYILDHLDLRRFFDVVVGADDVDAGKPHPETYATVAEELGVASANCLVFEDAIWASTRPTKPACTAWPC
jgi:HAD superfamily hydrolase (TIGR01509 family)